MNRRGGDEVVIIEDEQEGIGAVQFIQQRRKQALRRDGLRGLQNLRQRRTNAARGFAEGFEQITDEQRRIVFGFLQRQPGNGAGGRARLFRQQGRFPETGRRGDQGEFPSGGQAVLQLRDQPQARNQGGSKGRRVGFAVEKNIAVQGESVQVSGATRLMSASRNPSHTAKPGLGVPFRSRRPRIEKKRMVSASFPNPWLCMYARYASKLKSSRIR
jgi:hypothetical protein